MENLHKKHLLLRKFSYIMIMYMYNIKRGAMTNIRKKLKLYILLSILTASTIAMGVGLVGANDAMAEESEEYVVTGDTNTPAVAEPSFSVVVPELNALEITLPSRVVAIDVTPTPNTPSFASTDVEIKVGTSNETGYTLTMLPIYNNVATTVLTRTEAINGDTPTIDTLAEKSGGYTASEFENSSSTVNAWGYMLADSHIETTNYLPVKASAVTLNHYYQPVDSDPTTVTLAAKVSAAKPAGQYETTLRFTAVANAVTYAINFNRGRADSGVSVPSQMTGALNSSATTTVSLNGAEPGSWTGYAFTGWCSAVPTLSNNADVCPDGASSYASTSNITMSPENDIVTLYAMWSVRSFGINIKASTGVSRVSLRNQYTSEEICYATTTSSVSCGNLNYGTTYNLVATMATGYSFSGWTLDPNDGTLGSTSSASTTFTVGTQGTLISPSATLNSHTVTVTFAGSGVNSVAFYNATYGTSTATNNGGTGTATLRYNVPYTATASIASNYEISGWTSGTNTGVSATGATNPITVTLTGDADGTLTVTGKSSKLYMQGLNGASCVTGSTTTVYDSRDEQAYSIRRLSDGKCWMIKNLNLPGGTTVEPTKSDMTSGSYTLNASSTSGFNNDSGNFVYNSGNLSNTCTGSGCYSYYSWCAATAGSCSETTANGTNVSSSICPKGWKLPTATTSNANAQTNNNWKTGDFYALAKAYGANLESNYYESAGTFYNNAGPGTTPNFLLAGYYYGGSFGLGGSRGSSWSRTSYSSTNAYNLYFDSGGVYSAGYNSRRYGFAVRCVLSE